MSEFASTGTHYFRKGSYVKEQIIKVALEAQENGDIDAGTNVRDLVEFLEDAGKGVMISMKEMKDPYPIDNFLRMVKKYTAAQFDDAGFSSV